jgi:hypothetical protein
MSTLATQPSIRPASRRGRPHADQILLDLVKELRRHGRTLVRLDRERDSLADMADERKLGYNEHLVMEASGNFEYVAGKISSTTAHGLLGLRCKARAVMLLDKHEKDVNVDLALRLGRSLASDLKRWAHR